MEKIKQLLPVMIISLLVLFLSSCYRQTTIILPQGQTLPSSDDATSETVSSTVPEITTASSPDTSTVLPSNTPQETTAKESNHRPKETKPAGSIPVQTRPSSETTPPTETIPPVETTVPVETTMPADTTASAETSIPVEATVPSPAETTPMETTLPAKSTVPTETVPPTKPLEHPVYNISSHSIGSYEKSILEEMNRYRSDAGLSPLSMSKKLSALATIRAYECTKEFSHTRPDGRSWDTVLSDYGASAFAENILYSSSGTGAALLIDACIGSDSHRQKILNSDYSTVGIGIYDTGRYVFIVMIFC